MLKHVCSLLTLTECMKWCLAVCVRSRPSGAAAGGREMLVCAGAGRAGKGRRVVR